MYNRVGSPSGRPSRAAGTNIATLVLIVLAVLGVAALIVLAVVSLTATNNTLDEVREIEYPANGKLQFIVFDLFEDSEVPRSAVETAIEAVEEMANSQFAIYYGLGAEFEILPRGQTMNPVPKGVVIIYLASGVARYPYFEGSNHWAVLAPPNDCETCDGPQPQYLLNASLPLVPPNTRVIGVPYGGYGLSYFQTFCVDQVWIYGGPYNNTSAYEGCCSAQDMLGIFIGHETLETLADSYDGYNFAGNHFFGTPPMNGSWGGYLYEVCDPVAYGVYNVRRFEGVCVPNFVLPAYFSQAPQPGTALDFLGNVRSPGVPFGGYQFGIGINASGCVSQTVSLSNFWAPTVLDVFNQGNLAGSCV